MTALYVLSTIEFIILSIVAIIFFIKILTEQERTKILNSLGIFALSSLGIINAIIIFVMQYWG